MSWNVWMITQTPPAPLQSSVVAIHSFPVFWALKRRLYYWLTVCTHTEYSLQCATILHKTATATPLCHHGYSTIPLRLLHYTTTPHRQLHYNTAATPLHHQWNLNCGTFCRWAEEDCGSRDGRAWPVWGSSRCHAQSTGTSQLQSLFAATAHKITAYYHHSLSRAVHRNISTPVAIIMSNHKFCSLFRCYATALVTYFVWSAASRRLCATALVTGSCTLNGIIDKAVASYTESCGFDPRQRLYRFLLRKWHSGLLSARYHHITLQRVGATTSQLDLPSLTPLSVAGCGR